MKVAIVHLSDIHIRTRRDNCFARRDKLTNAIRFHRDPEEALLLVVTGDIANTGSSAEYDLAAEYFNPLFVGLGLDPRSAACAVLFIPGNHDCNLIDVGDLRPRLLNEIGTELEGLDSKGEIVRTLLSVQSNYFQFQESMTGLLMPIEDRLFSSRLVNLGKRQVEFRCFNSSWLSSRQEGAGTLGFPATTLEAASSKTDADVVISMVHHPSNWMNPAAHNAFRKVVQDTSDFLFTGHEHTMGGQVVTPFGGSGLVHIESGPLQPTDSGLSQFGILHLDLDEGTWRHEEFSWQRGAYARIRDDGPHKLARKTERVASLQVHGQFLKFLNDPGTGFLHPRKANLTLSDIYAYPDLKVRKLSRKLTRADELPTDIQSQQVVEKLVDSRRVAISGPADSGKTALSKMLFLDSNSKYSKYPLLLSGEAIKGKEPVRGFNAAVEDAVDEQYGRVERGKYACLGNADRVLLIDNWEEVPFNREGRSAILRKAEESFGSIVVFSDDVFLIEELSPRHEAQPLNGFEVADLREFGFRLRGQLIRKWNRLGSEYIENEEALARHIADSTTVIDTVLGRNLLPSYPVNILTLLQTYDTNAGAQSSGLGSYGQVYEALITARLTRVSAKAIDIGTTITFLARFAFRLFDQHERCISEAEWESLGRQYSNDYRIRIDSRQLLQACVAAGLLVRDDCGVRFVHDYAYCYFVAKYFQENLADLDSQAERAKLFERLQVISERIYNQDNANIVILYVFLTKDRALINHIVSNARKIFDDITEFDFDSHVGFVNHYILSPPPAALPSTTTEDNQQAFDRERDEAGEQLEPGCDPAAGEVQYSPEIPFDQKLVIGIRYITLMGQFLRNFPGSLKADTKLDLAFESYGLGLRILRIIFALSERDASKLAGDIAEVLRRKMAFRGTERELLDRAELILAELLRQVTYGLLKRLSHAVGLRELEETYDDVAGLRDNSLANRMIRLSIQLDHFERFPQKEIDELFRDLQQNKFTSQTLQDLVLNHLYLFPREYSIQQWVGDKFGIKVNLPSIRGGESKILQG